MMHQAGLLDYAVRKAKQTKNPCSTNAKNKENEAILLKLRDLSASFLVLAAGLGSAIVAFIAELVANIVVNRRDYKGA